MLNCNNCEIAQELESARDLCEKDDDTIRELLRENMELIIKNTEIRQKSEDLALKIDELSAKIHETSQVAIEVILDYFTKGKGKNGRNSA